jgi:hypothetical protein
MRSFITGIMPLALADASGYNVAKNITHDPRFASLVGFRKRDLERGLALIPHLNATQRDGALQLMRKYYNGYWFAGGTEPLYNSTQSLFFLENLADGTRRRRAARHGRRRQLRALVAPPVRRQRAEQQHCGARALGARKARAVASWSASRRRSRRCAEARQFTLEELFKVPSIAAAQALLFYQGIATFTDAEGRSLRVPNEVVRQTHFAPLNDLLQFRDIDLLLRAPSAALFEALFADIAKLGPGAVQNESTFQFHVALALANAVPARRHSARGARGRHAVRRAAGAQAMPRWCSSSSTCRSSR